jgi:general L-amino acid transport system substrate-binding protein
VILPELLTLDPYVPAVRANDTAWRRAVDASYFTLVQAEQANLTMQNVAARAAEANPSALLEKPGSGAPLGLADGWRAAELAQTGNYGEIYQRDLGDMSPLRLPRGLNRPWAEGGMLWAPPLD